MSDSEHASVHAVGGEDLLSITDGSVLTPVNHTALNDLASFVDEENIENFVDNFNENSGEPYKLRIVRIYPRKYWFENGRK